MLANSCQSWTIRCQSLANPWPVTFLTIEQVVYVGWSLVYSEDEFEATSIDNHNQFRPTMTSSRRSMPILANAMPIQGQSDVNLSPQPIIPLFQSQIGTILYNPCQAGTTRCQSLTNPMPIQGQSDSYPGPIRCQSRDIPSTNPESSDPFFCQFKLIQY